MQKKPILSIVTVVYNAKEFLEKTILSVVNNPSFNEIEYIIIDGASTDGTLEILKKYSTYIDFWISEQDSGLYDAMNKGIINCNGKWINFLNAGDILEFDAIVLNNYNNEDISMVYGLANIVNENGKYILTSGKQNIKPIDFINSMPICHQAVCYSINSIQNYDTSYEIISDREMTYKVISRNPNVVFDSKIRVVFMEGGVSHISWKKKYKEEVRFLKAIKSFTIKHRFKYLIKYYIISPLYSNLKDTRIMSTYREIKHG